MTIDKSWMTVRNRLSHEYRVGVCLFLQRAAQYVNENREIICPCNNCLNHLLQPLPLVELHLVQHGIQLSYKVWDYHGEKHDHPSAEKEVILDGGVHDEMVDILADISGHVEIGESSEPIQEGNDQNKNLDEIFKQMEKELYPGCKSFSALNFLVKLMHVKLLNKWSEKYFDMLLGLMKKAFPFAILPNSHYEAKSKVSDIGLGYEIIHVCQHDCALFWKENADLNNCPICGESLWVNKRTKGKKVPKKVVRYFPLTPRLKRLFSSRHTALDMRWHDFERPKENGVLRHPADGQAWKTFDKNYPAFAMDPRNVQLGLATDDFNPFGNMSTTYSMWPVMLVIYNMPPWKCMKSNNLILSLLIPGPKSPGQDIDVYLRPLVEELKQLWEQGVHTRDAVTGDNFLMGAAVMWTINDYPAYAMMSGRSTKGYKACPTCNEETPSKKIRSKIAYIGYRRFLPRDDEMRNSKKFDGQIERRGPPRKLTTENILA
ncbi:uncharacterized protein LOC133834781 [Humulus lupulus]|uniref:uncharacterized protein LOC133834781 n=1 Tax=Humulus lupulus TaxID=3486 RepID=UPI002B4149D6|nr:uncharacterized protein LOC133834781 [Humulus lupulus]